MAITLACLQHIKSATQQLNEAYRDTIKPVLALGYPDILASPSYLAELFDDSNLLDLPIRPDSAEIIRWHSGERITDKIVDSIAFFKALNFELEIADIAIIRGDERVMDLNHPSPDEYIERYYLLLDGGTLEHCFNIAQAAKNLAEMTITGGFVISVNPMSMFNHGFYNLNPTWYHDFYENNGFNIQSLSMTTHSDPITQYSIPPFQRFENTPDNSMLLMLAKKNKSIPINWPVQFKYRNYI
jgi:hypothetical protein